MKTFPHEGRDRVDSFFWSLGVIGLIGETILNCIIWMALIQQQRQQHRQRRQNVFLDCFEFSEQIGGSTTCYKLNRCLKVFIDGQCVFPGHFLAWSTGKSVRKPKCGYFYSTWNHSFIIIHHPRIVTNKFVQMFVQFFSFFRNLNLFSLFYVCWSSWWFQAIWKNISQIGFETTI